MLANNKTHRAEQRKICRQQDHTATNRFGEVQRPEDTVIPRRQVLPNIATVAPLKAHPPRPVIPELNPERMLKDRSRPK